MDKLTRSDLWSLEDYAEQRPQFRVQILAHKQQRKVSIGEHAILLFEDRLTMRYQIQEMLRVERIFEAVGIEDELATYNPLIPEGDNLKATFMLEYDDPEQRKHTLAQLIGIEDKIWIQVAGFEPSWAIADEDMERENEEKTSSVHFLRFQFSAEMIVAAKQGAGLAIGRDQPNYTSRIDVLPELVRTVLVADFD